MNCIICNNQLKEYQNRSEYVGCDTCHYVIKKEKVNNVDMNKQVYENITQQHSQILNLLNSDKKHYDDMFSYFNNRKDCPLKDLSFDKTYAFGGGFPKLETYLNTHDINVYDLCHTGYSSFIQDFRSIYKYDDKLDYNYFCLTDKDYFLNLLNSDIDKTSSDLLTFVHFLEHLDISLFIDTIKTLKKFKEDHKNKTFLIYQPCFNFGRDSNWCHWHVEHVTLPTYEFIYEFLENEGFEVIFGSSYSDDMLFVFK